MLVIRDLSEKQKRMLDKMWDFKTEQDLDAWTQKLSAKKRRQVSLLKELITIAAIDEIVDQIDDFSDITILLDGIIH